MFFISGKRQQGKSIKYKTSHTKQHSRQQMFAKYITQTNFIVIASMDMLCLLFITVKYGKTGNRLHTTLDRILYKKSFQII